MEASQAEMSVVGRMLRVFYTPSQTFEAVAKQHSAADWLVPTAVAALGFCFVSEAKITQQIPGEMFAAVPILAFMVLFINAAIYLVVGQSTGWPAQLWPMLDHNCVRVANHHPSADCVVAVGQGDDKCATGTGGVPLYRLVEHRLRHRAVYRRADRAQPRLCGHCGPRADFSYRIRR